MIDPYAGNRVEARQPRRLESHFAVNHFVVMADEDRLTEAEGADRASDFLHVDRVEASYLPLRWPKLVQRHVRDYQERQWVVALPARICSGLSRPAQIIASPTTLGLQLTRKRRSWIGTVSHGALLEYQVEETVQSDRSDK